HEASLLPVQEWPLLWSGAFRERWWRSYEAIVDRHPGLVDDVLAVVKERGPIGAGALEKALEAPTRPRPSGASWWERSDVKRLCDLPERVLPPGVLAAPRPDAAEAARTLVLGSAAALGVATEPELRDYYRIAPARSQAAVAELVEAGELERVQVRGWERPAY